MQKYRNFITATNPGTSIKTAGRESRKKNQRTTRTNITRRNPEEKDCHKNKNAKKGSENNVKEDAVYDELFIAKTSNQEHDSETFIADYGATSHMLNLEENTTNLKDAQKRVTIGDSRTLTGTKCGNWHGWHRRDGKIH